MRVFVTGASGYIGGAVARAFARAGHEVTGLVRDEAKGASLRAAEVRTHVGDLAHPSSYKAAAESAEVLVHCAFETSAEAVARDASAIHTLIEAARVSGRPRAVLYTSGVWVYGSTGNRIVDESDAVSPLKLVAWRPLHERTVLDAAAGAVRTVVFRPGCVYGGSGSLTGFWFQSAVETGAAAMAGDGSNHWAMVHLDDLAQAYLLAAEKELSGVILTLTDGSHTRVRTCAEAASRATGKGGAVKALTEAEAQTAYGPVAEGLLVDQWTSNARAERLLGWRPRHPSFPAAADRCFISWRAAS